MGQRVEAPFARRLRDRRSADAARMVLLYALLVLLALLFATVHAVGAERNENLVWTTGRIVDANNKPVPGALVAAFDDKNNVVDYGRTDANGEYALAVPKNALHLEPKHGKDFFTQVVSSITRFVSGQRSGLWKINGTSVPWTEP